MSWQIYLKGELKMNTEEIKETTEENVNDVTNSDVEESYNQNDESRYGTPEMKEPSNPITGIVGAVIGSLLGVALWIIIYHLGYIASLAGLAIIICAFKGYEILGRSLDKKGVIITSVIALVMVFVANHMAWTVECYLEIKDYFEVSFNETLKWMPDLIKEADAVKEYISDLGFGYLLTLIGGVSTIVSKFKQAK